MPDEESRYFIQRAEAEIDLAQRAEHPKAVAAHYHLAQSYLDRAYGPADENDQAPVREPD